jgi:hypothetical protein
MHFKNGEIKCISNYTGNFFNSITSAPSKFIDFHLKTLVYKHSTTIKDSQNFIQKTKDLKFSKNSKLYTSDFVTL